MTTIGNENWIFTDEVKKTLKEIIEEIEENENKDK
jgi:hypothetical protein